MFTLCEHICSPCVNIDEHYFHIFEILVAYYEQLVYNIKHRCITSVNITNQYLGGYKMSHLSVMSEENISKLGHETGLEISFDERQKQLAREKEIEEQKLQKQKEQEKKSLYSDFAQVNRKEMIHMRALIKSDPNAALVLMFIMEKMDKMNALVCSYQVLQEQLGLGRTTLSKAVKTLKDKGFLYVYKSGSSNVYVLNNQLVWTNHGDKAKYCLFPANVILSAAEQEEIKKANNLKTTFNKSIELKEQETS